jgi:hypothetical protein
VKTIVSIKASWPHFEAICGDGQKVAVYIRYGRATVTADGEEPKALTGRSEWMGVVGIREAYGDVK